MNQSSFTPPPTRISHTIALLSHDYCAMYDPPPTPRVYAMHYTILVMAISCKGQVCGRSVHPSSPRFVLIATPIAPFLTTHKDDLLTPTGHPAPPALADTAHGAHTQHCSHTAPGRT